MKDRVSQEYNKRTVIRRKRFFPLSPVLFALPSDRCAVKSASDLPDQIDHLDGAGGAVVSLVAGFCPGSFDGLFDVVRG